MTHRFYIPRENINVNQKTAVLSGSEWVHASKVLRLKQGDDLEFFDGRGNVYRSIISTSNDKSFSLNIIETTYYKKDYSLSVFIGVPKGSKIDLIIKALTEAGATVIGMFTSKYSEVRAKSAQKIERLRNISTEACKQSQRAWLPTLDINLSFNDMLARVQEAHNSVVFYEQASVYQSFSSFQSKDLALVIGPEGGFAGSEVDQLKAKGATVSRLGDAVLRVETAAITATSLARYAQLLSD